MKQAIAYLRVSGQGQADGQGLDRQKVAIETYCRDSGLTIAQTYQDILTGTGDALNRPGFSQMIAELNGVRVIVVERLDRLARAIMVQEQTITWLAAHDVSLVAADTGEDITEAYKADPMKRAMIQIQGVFAELEKSMLVKKLRLARQKVKVANGKCEGQKAYGEVNSNEKEVVRIVRRLCHSGWGYRRIGRHLDRIGVPTRSGRLWNPSTVRSIVLGKVFAELENAG